MSKLLAEYLQEQQEPFALEAYLLERGYPRGKNLNARYTLFASAKFKKSGYEVPNCTDFLRAVFSHLVMANSNQKLKNAAQERHKGEVNVKRKIKCRSDEDSKQLSPISVLEESEWDQDSPVDHSKPSSSKPQCKWKKPMHYRLQRLVGSCPYDQYTINKRDLQQRKQLLIDCVREVLEKNKKREKSKEEIKQVLGADELWKLVCENVWIWSQETINQSNIIHLLHSDFLDLQEEFNADFELHKMEICVQVENAIFEDVINEIVTS